jgi:hypothetical protein
MDWVQGLFNLLSACVGGAIAILVQRYSSRDEARIRAMDGLADIYTDFMVAFHTALLANEDYYESVRLRNERGWDSKESDETRKARVEAEQRFREAVWRLRVRERDPEQKKELEAMARVFDSGVEEFDMQDSIADEYPRTADALRAKAAAIIDRMQTLHGDRLPK